MLDDSYRWWLRFLLVLWDASDVSRTMPTPFGRYTKGTSLLKAACPPPLPTVLLSFLPFLPLPPSTFAGSANGNAILLHSARSLHTTTSATFELPAVSAHTPRALCPQRHYNLKQTSHRAIVTFGGVCVPYIYHHAMSSRQRSKNLVSLVSIFEVVCVHEKWAQTYRLLKIRNKNDF